MSPRISAGWAKLPGERKRAAKRNLAAALALNNRHRGETVYVVGSGPSLNALSDETIARLGRAPSIALNRVQYLVPTRYFLSAYPAEIMLARRRLPAATIVHMRPAYEPPIIPRTIAIRRTDFTRKTTLNTAFEPPEPTLYTLRNVALGATHLAMILGATRVVYIGVEQRSALHFYDERPAFRGEILADLESLPDKHLFDADHPYATYEGLVEKLERDPDELRGTAFYKRSHADTFSAYFKQLRANGVEPVATTSDSVIADAGASVMSLDEALGGTG